MGPTIQFEETSHCHFKSLRKLHKFNEVAYSLVKSHIVVSSICVVDPCKDSVDD
jgi:hypothetical protein